MTRDLGAMRRMIARMEGRGGGTWTGPATGEGSVDGNRGGPELRIHTGVPGLDQAFAGTGLAGDAVHEVHASEARLAGAATGFLVALLSRLRARNPVFRDPVLWVQDPVSARESGRLHGPGLQALGLDPGRVVLVAARSVAQALWAMEEGLDCAGMGAVVGEIRGASRALDLTATRRLALRAAAARRPVFLFKTSAAEEPTAAVSRWRVTPLGSAPLDDYRNGLGRAAWRIELRKNRDGRTGAWSVEWNHHDQCFVPAAADPVPVAATAGDRPARPAQMGAVVALERAG